MRAKMKIAVVHSSEFGDKVDMYPVAGGTPEDNTFAQYTPSGLCTLDITNPALIGKFKPGQVFYVDFTEVPENNVLG